MALHNTVYKIGGPLTLDGEWASYTSTDVDSKGYFALVKDTAITGNLDKDLVTKVRIEIGIDSGVDGLIVLVGTYDFDFSLPKGDNIETNERVALLKYHSLPEKFWYKVKYIEVGTTRYDSSSTIDGLAITTDIDLNQIRVDTVA